MGHIQVEFDEQARWLRMDRGDAQVLMNLGQQDVGFEMAAGFRVALISRDGVGSNAGKIVLPGMTLAVLTCEPEPGRADCAQRA
jgi:hypothetical protein